MLKKTKPLNGLLPILAIALTSYYLSGLPEKQRTPADDSSESSGYYDNAYDAYVALRKSQITKEPIPVKVKNADPSVNQGAVSYGGEKEGSSARLAKIMSPSGEYFQSIIDELPEEQQIVFLKTFMQELSERQKKTVTKLDGTQVVLSGRTFREIEWSSASLAQLRDGFLKFLTITEGNPFSFLPQKTRRKLFNKDYPGLRNANKPFLNFKKWIPQFGMPEKFIDQAVSQDTIDSGWEILTKPQFTYGEHEQMITWFKKTMGTKDREFQAPGHQRVLWPTPDLPEEEFKVFKKNLGGMYRLGQALIVLEGIAGKTNINFGHWKFMIDDQSMQSHSHRRNDIFRFETNRFVDGSMAVEMRAGTKDIGIQRFIQQTFTARIATQDFSEIPGLDEWTMIPRPRTEGGYPSGQFPVRTLPNPNDVVEEYNLSLDKVGKAFENISKITRKAPGRGDQKIYIKPEFWIPFWNWQEAPFLSENKKKILQNLTRDFLINLAEIDDPTEEKIQRLFQDWARVSELDQDIREILRPNKPIAENVKPALYPISGTKKVDVNKIHMGIEYSARFPIKNKAVMSEANLGDNKKHWLITTYDLSDKEREKTLKLYAENLAKSLGVENPLIEIDKNFDSHGHGLDIAYKLKDNKNREWRVEWDGIGRSYSPSSEKALKKSKRGGHIEVVTPKFVPTYEDSKAVYDAFAKTNLVPAYQAGGSHVNFNLSAFSGKPKEFARFLAAFHEVRSIMALMFQHPSRMVAAEQIPISDNLERQLKDFSGTEAQLKQLLYNEGYFNKRVGRKSRYVQLDVSAYFQDVIPEKFIHDDFDIGNPFVPWRRQFRVNPKIRKGEFRLFGSPESAFEGALQVKIVRALLNKAFNDTSPIMGSSQNKTHTDYFNNPKEAYNDLKKLGEFLQLDTSEYEMMVARGLEKTEQILNSEFYMPLDQKLAQYPVVQDWDQAIAKPRSKSNALNSSKIQWQGEDLLPEAAQHQATRIAAVKKAQELRKKLYREDFRVGGSIIRRTKFQRSIDCNFAIKELSKFRF